MIKAIQKFLLLLSILTCSSGIFTACNPTGSSSSSSSGNESSSTSSSSDTDSPVDDTDEYISPPAEDSHIQYSTPTWGNGGEYSRFSCTEGYYEFSVSTTKKYYSFSVDQPGQYALYTIEPVEYIELERYNADANYINTEGGIPAIELQSGRIYSRVNCGEKYFNTEWRATYSLKSLAGTQTVRVRFVRVADPEFEPEILITKVNAEEIEGVANTVEYCMPLAVPYTSQYFYDENYELTFNTPIGAEKTGEVTAKGFYRMGSPENPGAVIYVALETSSRFMEGKFSEANSGFIVQYDKDNKGNILAHDYSDFISNKTSGTEDKTKACYVNVCNSDGLFPVNRELYGFLKEYVIKDKLSDEETVDEENAWLAACFYYAEATEGNKSFPKEIPTTAFSDTVHSISYTVNIDREYTMIYHNIKWHQTGALTDGFTSGYYTVTSDDENAWLTIDGKNYNGKFSVTFEVDSKNGKTFAFSYGTTPETAGQTGTFEVTFTKTDGVYATPYALTSLTDVKLSTNEIINADGDIVYFAVYQYTAIGENSTLSLLHDVEGVTLEVIEGADENNLVVKDDDGKISFSILVSSTKPINDIPVQITLTPVPATE